MSLLPNFLKREKIVQRCPSCDKEVEVTRGFTQCQTHKCQLGALIFKQESWNHIRLAPNGELLRPKWDYERDCLTVKYEDWMQPHYIKEDFDKIIKERDEPK